ncbi:MAG: hypothetical protein ACFB10_23885 [Salibacteraceae bacterium]
MPTTKAVKPQFPILNISEKRWDEDDYLECLNYDGYIYDDKPAYFESYYRQKVFVDSDGKLFQAIGVEWPQGLQKWTKSLFGKNRGKLSLQPVDRTVPIDDLKAYCLARIIEVDDGEAFQNLMETLEEANSFKEVIDSI